MRLVLSLVAPWVALGWSWDKPDPNLPMAMPWGILDVVEGGYWGHTGWVSTQWLHSIKLDGTLAWKKTWKGEDLCHNKSFVPTILSTAMVGTDETEGVIYVSLDCSLGTRRNKHVLVALSTAGKELWQLPVPCPNLGNSDYRWNSCISSIMVNSSPDDPPYSGPLILTTSGTGDEFEQTPGKVYAVATNGSVIWSKPVAS